MRPSGSSPFGPLGLCGLCGGGGNDQGRYRINPGGYGERIVCTVCHARLILARRRERAAWPRYTDFYGSVHGDAQCRGVLRPPGPPRVGG